MHSSVRWCGAYKKHGRSVIVVGMVTSMLMYVVSRDSPGPTDVGALQRGIELLTITLSKDQVHDMLDQKEQLHNMLDKMEERMDRPTQAVIQDDVKTQNKKEKKQKLNKIALPMQDNEPVKPVIENKQSNKPVSRAMNKLLSKYKNSNFVVIRNKVYQKKDLNSTGAQAAILAAGLGVDPDEEEEEPVWPPVMEPSEAAMLRQIDISNYNEEDRSFLESRMSVYEDRARQVGAACDSGFPNNQWNSPRSPHLIWDAIHHPNIVFCPNYKVASTTWMMYFLRMVHFNEDNPEIAKLPPDKRDAARFSPHYGAKQNKVHDYYPVPSSVKEKVSFFKQALRVIIVRHPFTRILSAYRDKMVKMTPRPKEFKFRDLQLEIIAKYRKPDSDEKSPYPTFAEFIQHVIDSTANFTTSKDWQRNVKCWTPFWTQCEVCSLDFNFIMKLETMVDDEHFLITMSNLKELKELKELEWRHKKNGSSFDLAPEFYKQITQEQIRMLYQRYKLDFEIFDYNIVNYLAIAKDA